jgi:hypothetical protein
MSDANKRLEAEKMWRCQGPVNRFTAAVSIQLAYSGYEGVAMSGPQRWGREIGLGQGAKTWTMNGVLWLRYRGVMMLTVCSWIYSHVL